jgi:hypothetical protein
MIREIFRRAAIGVWVLQAGLVLGAQSVMAPDTIPLIQWAYTVALALAGGAAASFTRYAAGAPTDRWKLELGRDFFCSLLAGVLALFVGLHYEVPPLLAAVAIAAAGWGGSRLLELAYKKYQRRVIPQ